MNIYQFSRRSIAARRRTAPSYRRSIRARVNFQRIVNAVIARNRAVAASRSRARSRLLSYKRRRT